MTDRCPKDGMVLVLVLVVIAVVALAGLTFSELMLVERKAADLSCRQAQARCSADSGLQMVRLFMAQPIETIDQSGGWYDNGAQFQRTLVADSDAAVERGCFAVVAPTVDQNGGRDIRFGIDNESSRLNLNTLLATDESEGGSAREILMQLPNMTEDTADAILDWIDSDEIQREFGAEAADYYSGLDPPYAPKNGPLETVEELLLVRGVTPELLFGADANHNGIVDENETAADALLELDTTGGSMDCGWAAYLTLYSRESNLGPDGLPKIDLNQDDLEQLHDELQQVLGAEAATFVVAYRQNGPYSGDRTPGQSDDVELDFEQKAKHELKSILDLIGAKVEIESSKESGSSPRQGSGGGGGRQPPGDSKEQGNDDSEPTILESPFPNTPGSMGDFLPSLLENCTTDSRSTIPGRININQAPREVLAGIPEMPAEVGEQILATREPNPTGADENRLHATWILDARIVTLDQMKALLPYVTCGGDVYRAQVIGYADGGGPAARIEAVIDATEQPAQVVFWRDLSHLGHGYPIETLGVETTE